MNNEFQVGDLIKTKLSKSWKTNKLKRTLWIGLVIDPRGDDFFIETMLVLVVKNNDYPEQVGTVQEWTKHANWELICRK